MPYVSEKTKELLDAGAGPLLVGELTYEIQQTLDAFLLDKLRMGGVRYRELAECLAALEGARADFIERILKPYEALKQAENGDVWSRAVLNAVHGTPDA